MLAERDRPVRLKVLKPLFKESPETPTRAEMHLSLYLFDLMSNVIDIVGCGIGLNSSLGLCNGTIFLKLS